MASIEVHLSSNGWRRSPNQKTSVVGAFFEGEERVLDVDVLARLPKRYQNESVESVIRKMNGFFALIKELDDGVLAFVDRVRSFPLFYAQKDGGVFLSDDAEWLRRKICCITMDAVAAEEFQLAGYVTGNETLFHEIKQLQAGELIYIPYGESLEVITSRWYLFDHKEPDVWREEELYNKLEKSVEASVKRLAAYAGGRQIVMPLSGGYDCRLIALSLKKIGYNNVLTFTYGVRGNKESEYSKAVARQLGFKWHFVEYTEEKWRDAWGTEERREYQRWASGWSSIAHVQDWLAVREMKMEAVISEEAVFCPGHGGDFCAGSHIPVDAIPGSPADTRNLVGEILRRHYVLTSWGRGPECSSGFWSERVLSRVRTSQISTGEEYANYFEMWDWQERQAKLITNSVRVYDFYGYDWWLPLWDMEFMCFWEEAPLKLRKGECWYAEYVKDKYKEMIGEVVDNANSIGFWGRLIRWVLPVGFIKYLKERCFIKRDVMLRDSRHDRAMYLKLSQKGYSLVGVACFEFLLEATNELGEPVLDGSLRVRGSHE